MNMTSLKKDNNINFKDFIVSLNLDKIKKENISNILPIYLDYTIGKFFINSEENRIKIDSKKKEFFEQTKHLFSNINYSIFANIFDVLDNLSAKINSFIKTEEDQIFSIASGHIMLLSFYIDRCKRFNIKNPYEHNNLENNYDVYEESYFKNIDYMNYKKFISMENDLLYDYSSFNVFNKLLVKKNSTFLELPQEMFVILSTILSFSKKEEFIKEIYEELSCKRISLSTPIMSNLRTITFKNTASCFILKFDDNLKSIFKSISDVALISQAGGGVGVNLSSIRSKGSSVRGREKTALGIMNVCKILDVVSHSVSQGGKRSAAITTALDIWHIEVTDFLEINLESGDNRMKCFDIFPQIVVNDLFMKKIELKENWYLLDPKNIKDIYEQDISILVGKDFEDLYNQITIDILKGDKKIIYKKVKAIELIKKIIEAQIETGLPYMFFKDTVNENNPNIDDGKILSGNLCQESFTNFGTCGDKENLYHTCNLLSLNLSNILDMKTLEKSSRIGVYILNSLFDIENPIKESRAHNYRYRTIGIGALGLHDHLAYKNISFGTKESVDYIDKIFHSISYFTAKTSVNMSECFNFFPAYEKSQYKKGFINGKTCSEMKKKSQELNLNLDWKDVFKKMEKYGIYNSQILAIAPNTNTSIFQNASASVLPVYSKFFVDNNSHSLVYTFPRYVFTNLDKYVPYVSIDMKNVIKIISTIQSNIDQGISFELFFDINKNIKAKHIKDIIFLIWKSKCKTIYYTRTLQRFVEKENNCEACTL